MVMTEKVIQGKQDYKAKLVVQGCQEVKGYIKPDAPTMSRDDFFMTLAAKQDGWDLTMFDGQSASPVGWHRETAAAADATQKSATWSKPNKFL